MVRIEDLDPPREQSGATNLILDQLLSLGLEWDNDVLFQSTRLNAYQSALHKMSQKSLPIGVTVPALRLKKEALFMMATAEREIEHPNIVLLSESKRRIERSVFR